MDFNKIIKLIEQKKIGKEYFAKTYTGMTWDGLKSSCENETLKVTMLEKVTKGLGLQMAYWWEDEFSIVEDDKTLYKSHYNNSINNLQKQINGYVEKELEYREEISQLKAKLGIKKGNSKATG